MQISFTFNFLIEFFKRAKFDLKEIERDTKTRKKERREGRGKIFVFLSPP